MVFQSQTLSESQLRNVFAYSIASRTAHTQCDAVSSMPQSSLPFTYKSNQFVVNHYVLINIFK